MIKNCFINPHENRLRAGWRILLLLIATPIVSRILNVSLKPIFGGTLENNMVRWVFRGIIVVILAPLVVGVCRRFLDKKSFVSLGLRFNKLSILDVLVGFVLSGLMVGIVFIILLYSGLFQIQEISWTGSGISSILEIFFCSLEPVPQSLGRKSWCFGVTSCRI